MRIETRIGGTLFYFLPNHIFIVPAIDQAVDFAVGGVVKKNSTLYTLSKKQQRTENGEMLPGGECLE